MFVIAVEFKIHPANADQFRETILKQAANSLSLEPDCHQFDVCFGLDDPTHCFLYEKYTDEAAFQVHRNMPHFAQFSSDVETWVDSKEVKSWVCEA